MAQVLKKADPKRAVKLFKLAAAQKNEEALYNLALCYDKGVGVEKDKGKAAELYKQAEQRAGQKRGNQEQNESLFFTSPPPSSSMKVKQNKKKAGKRSEQATRPETSKLPFFSSPPTLSRAREHSSSSCSSMSCSTSSSLSSSTSIPELRTST